MITLMRPVITFLNKLDAEKEKEPGVRPLEEAVKGSNPRRFSEVDIADSFSWPKPAPAPTVPPKGRILYRKPREEIDQVKRVLNVKTNKEVGEKTFEYFFRRECED